LLQLINLLEPSTPPLHPPFLHSSAHRTLQHSASQLQAYARIYSSRELPIRSACSNFGQPQKPRTSTGPPGNPVINDRLWAILSRPRISNRDGPPAWQRRPSSRITQERHVLCDGTLSRCMPLQKKLFPLETVERCLPYQSMPNNNQVPSGSYLSSTFLSSATLRDWASFLTRGNAKTHSRLPAPAP
jgi:hypothetical protein